MSEDEARQLVQLRTETRNLDYKGSFDWNTASSDEKISVIKDILAMLNTQDGGRIVFGVEDSTFEPTGMSQEDFESFDSTKVNDLLRRYTDPPASCELQKFVLGNLRFVIIDVPEFLDVAIICKADFNSTLQSAKLLLRKGAVYIRTSKPSSEAVSNAEEMRDLLTRSILKKGDQLLQTIEALIKGKPTSQPDQSREAYSREIEAAVKFFEDSLPIAEEEGNWVLRAMPNVYVESRITSLSTVGRLIAESEVALRGWNFPYTDRETASNFAQGRQSATNWDGSFRRHLEGYRAYTSGLFMWAGAYWEDSPQYSKNGRVLSFVNAIYQITEFFLFLKRYYARFADDATLNVRIKLNDTKDRRLVSMDPHVELSGNYVCKDPEIALEGTYAVAELRASAEEIARRTVQRIFEIFNWNEPDENMLQSWQTKLLERRF